MRKGIYIVLALLLSVAVWAEKPYTVVLDAGHGAPDGGAVGASGTEEKDINLDIVPRRQSVSGIPLPMTKDSL